MIGEIITPIIPPLIISKPLEVANSLQKLTSFPNNNEKRIDYVITYEFDAEDEQKEIFKAKERKREAFLKKLQNETIEIYKIRREEKKSVQIFYLMHCPMKRLFEEAERIKLEMKISNVLINFSLHL